MLTRNSQLADRYCILGAGASGLAVSKTFKQRGIPFDCLEREDDIGGLWNYETPSSVVYETTEMVSSKEFTAFEDYPMPDDYPLYPSHRLAMKYLRDYAEHFGLLDHIELGCTVERVANQDGAWRVWVAGETEPRSYKGVIVASGHHDRPRMPDYPGQFAGKVIHTREYRSQRQLTGKRILVVGGGNSACDVVNDGVQHANRVVHSIRHGYYFLNKFTFGIPTDDIADFIEKLRLPRFVRQRIYGWSHRLLVGRMSRYGLPDPEHKILDTHPTMSSELPGHVAHGRVVLKGDIEHFAGSRVVFDDGSNEEIDLVVFATGYEMSFPFLDESLVLGNDGKPNLYLNVFHPERDDLFTVGLIQANGSMWRLADLQGQLIANYITAMAVGDKKAKWFRKLKSAGAGDRAGLPTGYMPSERHKLEVDYFGYRRVMKKLARKFGQVGETPYPATEPAYADSELPQPETEELEVAESKAAA